MTFDAPPASGEIRIVRRQREDRVEMLGQYHYCVDDKWAFSASRTQRVAQEIDVVDEDAGTSVCKRNREEERSPGNEIAPIVDHARPAPPPSQSRISLRSCGLQLLHMRQLVDGVTGRPIQPPARY